MLPTHESHSVSSENATLDRTHLKRLQSKSLFYRIKDIPRKSRFNYPGVLFADVQVDYLDIIQQLHDVLFPIKYSRKFYESLCDPRECMITLLAFEDLGENILDESDQSEEDEDLLAEFGGLVGVVTAKIVWNQTCTQIREWYISTLGVSPNFRGKGIGRCMLQNILGMFMECLPIGWTRNSIPKVSLHVKHDNHPAIALYESEGFEMTQKLKDHYYFDEAFHDAFEYTLIIEYPDKYGLEDIALDEKERQKENISSSDASFCQVL